MNRPVRLINPASWLGHEVELAAHLRTATVQGRGRTLPSRGEVTASAVTVEIDQPAFWAERPDALSATIRAACGTAETAPTIDSSSAAFPAEDRLTMSVEQAAAALGISRALAYDAVARGEIPCIRIGRRILIPRAALDRLLTATAATEPGEDE